MPIENPTACLAGKCCPRCKCRNLALSILGEPPNVRCLGCDYRCGTADLEETATTTPPSEIAPQ